MSEYTIPKKKLSVTIMLADGEELVGNVFIGFYPTRTSGLGQLSAFLEGSEDFMPFVLNIGGTVFINKENVKAVIWRPGESGEEVESGGSLIKRLRCAFVYLDGPRVEGEFLSEVPQEHSRISDCLNIAKRFLVLKTGDSYNFVNKARVLKVEG